jgi:hypothetical protein
MTDDKRFWYALMIGLLTIYIAAIALVMLGQPHNKVVTLAEIIFIAHALEIPLAFRVLKSLEPNPPRLVIATLLFGLVWWVPAKRGLFPVE